MSIFKVYRDYFDIDPEYFPAVNSAVIQSNPDMWKKFYPHETFIKLIKSTVDVLERKQKLCLWVEGAYGTGKSHAVLTLKKLLDASVEDMREYFVKYNLNMTECKKLEGIKSSGKILTVHRYGSASIHGDQNLVFAVQESIEQAMVEAGIENKSGSALKEATINWLSDPYNHEYFNGLITGAYSDIFGGETVDEVLDHLHNYTGNALAKIMDSIFKVADERQIRALTLSTSELSIWIKEVIKANNLTAIVFIWDEFSEYLRNNRQNITGFQELCEISATDPFYFVIVSHEAQAIFGDDQVVYPKLNDRFVRPHCTITLPENIAFQLMGAAMEKNSDPQVAAEWENAVVGDLISRTKESRNYVKNVAKISDKEMQGILPIHPYAALLLKHISAAFDSNQRSMFDFIKNDRGDEIKGFQWFIDKYGPYDENPLLTVDMLWDFFYEKGRDSLKPETRTILDYYMQMETRQLDYNQRRVLKTVLMLQAVSLRAGESVEYFIPDERNLEMAFEGTDMEHEAVRCAKQLVRDKVLFEKFLGEGKYQFAPYSSDMDIDLTEYLAQIDKKTTSELISTQLNDGSCVTDAITLGGAQKLRYELRYVSSTDFEQTTRLLRNTEDKYADKIVAVVCFAKDDNESVILGQKIDAAVRSGSYNMIFIDTSVTPFGKDGYVNYRQYMAQSMAHQGKNNTLATQYSKDAKDALKKWKNRIAEGEFVVYSQYNTSGERATTMDALYDVLARINKKKYPESLEANYNVTSTMFMPTSLKLGVECGCEQKTRQAFSSGNPATKLENALQGAWKVDNYWAEHPTLHISKIKIKLDGMMQEAFAKSGKVSIQEIYDMLKAEPYGFMPCNLTAFMMGFLLKEYVGGNYSWSNNITNDILDVNKLKEMVDEVIHQDITANARYKEKYIVAFTPEEKAFNDLTATAFCIEPRQCISVPSTRELIRGKMKTYSFPIWTLKYILDKTPGLATDTEVLVELIDQYTGIANNNNIAGNKSESDIAMQIGTIAMANPTAAQDLKQLLNKVKIQEGMDAYLAEFEGGELLALAKEVDDGGKYMTALHNKFDANEANWLWSADTAQQKIREVILEYKIIAASNKIITKNTSFSGAISDWCKSTYIHISYEAGKSSFGKLGPLFAILYEMKKTGRLEDGKKEAFLEQLNANGEAFKEFYNNQIDTFKDVCDFQLNGMTDEEIAEIYTLVPDAFIWQKNQYFKEVENQVKEYKSKQKGRQLKEMWKQKTGTESPRDWSNAHKMPILCLVPDSEKPKARRAFDTIARKKADSAAVEDALEYLKKLDAENFFDKLKDSAYLDEVFTKYIIKDYDVALTDIDDVKEQLGRRTSIDPNEWLGASEVDKTTKKLAQHWYDMEGCEQAEQIVNSMDAETLRKYLQELLKDNMTVGMEIIRDNKKN